MKKTAVNFLLFLAGTIITYEFYVILTKGKIYPIPNIFALVIYSILILGVMVFAFWSYLTYLRPGSLREGLPSLLLSSVSMGLLVTHTILPVIFLTHGWPISSYYGHEPDTIIALGELSLVATAGLYGLYGLSKACCALKQLHAKKSSLI